MSGAARRWLAITLLAAGIIVMTSDDNGATIHGVLGGFLAFLALELAYGGDKE